MSDLTHWHLSQRLTDHCCGWGCGEELLRPADCCHRDWGRGRGCLFLRAAGERSVYLVLTDCHSDDAKVTGRVAFVHSWHWKISCLDGKLQSVEKRSIPLHSKYGESLGNSWYSVRLGGFPFKWSPWEDYGSGGRRGSFTIVRYLFPLIWGDYG